MAQLGSAHGWGPWGRKFKSCHPDHVIIYNMKQRVVTQIIIHNRDGKVLVMRRSTGSPDAIGQYELPGGTLDSDEQPEDSIIRNLANNLGIKISNFNLKDALAMDNREDSDIQHIFIVYESFMSELIDVKPQGSYDAYMWANYDDLVNINLRDSAASILNIVPRHLYEDNATNHNSKNTDLRYILFSDGGSRGNPGSSASGFVLFDNLHQQVIEEGGTYLGVTTNNQAEYHGLRLGLEHAIKKGIRNLECRLDSTLVVNQLKGVYKIKNRDLWPVYERILSYISMFDDIKFTYIPRENNKHADAIVNRILDENTLKTKS